MSPPTTSTPGHAPASGSIAAIGLAAALWTWIIIYIAMCPAVAAPPWLALTVIGGGLLAAGWAVGHWAGAGVAGGLKVGTVTALLHLLILGSLLGEHQTAETWRWAGIAAAVYVGGAVILGGAGALLAGRRPPRAVCWTSVLAIVSAVAALMLIVAGGIVTGLEAGLAIRGWLTANDYALVLFPLAHMQQDAGVYAEHSHRLWGLFVGLSIILLVVRLWRSEPRRGVAWFATGILAAVILQGVLGGTRVLGESLTLAIIHGVFAQAIFAALVAVAVIAAPSFAAGAAPPIGRRAPVALAVVLLGQLTLGALYRHLNGEPDAATALVHGLLGGHIVGALVVTTMAVVAGGTAVRSEDPIARRTGGLLLTVVIVQLAFGVAALLAVLAQRDADATGWQVALTTAHQTTGAVLLAAAGVLITLSRRPGPA